MESLNEDMIVLVSLLVTGTIACAVGYAIWRFRRTLDSLIPDLPRQVREAQADLDRKSAEELAITKVGADQKVRFTLNADRRYWSKWDYEQRQSQFMKHSWLIDATIARMAGERPGMDVENAKVAGAVGLLDAMREVTGDIQETFGEVAEQRIQDAVNMLSEHSSLLTIATEQFEYLYGHSPSLQEMSKMLQLGQSAVARLVTQEDAKETKSPEPRRTLILRSKGASEKSTQTPARLHNRRDALQRIIDHKIDEMLQHTIPASTESKG